MNHNNPTSVKIGLSSVCRKDRYSSYFAITKTLATTGIADLEKLRIGTVDKMQGQGAAAVIDSMTSTSPDYIANQAEWLFSSNSWKVALSRAHACAIVVGDLEAHLHAEPKSLDGIAAQQEILEVMVDTAWKLPTATTATPSPTPPPTPATVTSPLPVALPVPAPTVASPRYPLPPVGRQKHCHLERTTESASTTT